MALVKYSVVASNGLIMGIRYTQKAAEQLQEGFRKAGIDTNGWTIKKSGIAR